jgi:hypothetical protein
MAFVLGGQLTINETAWQQMVRLQDAGALLIEIRSIHSLRSIAAKASAGCAA